MSSDDRTPPAVTYQSAMAELPELPEAWRSAVYREAAKMGLTESDPLWWFLVAHAVLLKVFLDGLPLDAAKSSGQNGSEALKMTPPQFYAIKTLLEQQAAAIKSVPANLKEALASRGGDHNPDLDAFLEDWRITKAQHQKRRLWDRIAGWSFIVVVAAGLIAIACLVTYLLTWRSAQMEANLREARMIAAQPYDQQMPAFLAAHRARMFKGPLAQNQDHPETQGLVIAPGDLRLSNSWVSTNGDTVIPIQ